MTKDELLKYTKENYPVGTKYKCPQYIGHHGLGAGINIVESGDIIKFRVADEIDIIGKGYIYYKGKWAEIIEEPKIEPKFEVGKWYKGLGGSKNYYGICAGKISEGEFPCKIYIKPDGEYVTNGTHFYDFNGAELLTDLSEIQQYLPEGHKDKFATPIAKEEFVLPEKWGVKVTDENKSIIHEWKINNTRCSNFTVPDDYVFNDGTWANTIPDCTEITFDQFKKYVLKQEVKEEVKSIEEWSIGSYVVFLKDYGGHSKGTIDIIKNIGKHFITVKNCFFNSGVDECNLYKDDECKWFPTLQEAQKFSDELLGKSKTSLRVEDLVEGEIYRHDEGNLMESVKIPEYIKYLGKTNNYNIQGVIYKVISWGKNNIWVENNSLVNYKYNDKLCMDSLFEDIHKWEYSTREDYESQFKKDDKFKNGDWLVYIEYCGCKPTTPIKIGDVRQMIEGRFGSLSIYGNKDLSQYFRRALPNEIPVNNSIKEAPKLVFPYKVGDKIRCIKLNTWDDIYNNKSPIGICEGNVVEITKVGNLNRVYKYIPFAATYDGVEYGFSYSDDNKYELVESLEDTVIANYMDIFNKIGMLPLTPEECYFKKQEFKNPLDDSEREVNINFSKPKQIKF